jgi:hypothetical protein
MKKPYDEIYVNGQTVVKYLTVLFPNIYLIISFTRNYSLDEFNIIYRIFISNKMMFLSFIYMRSMETEIAIATFGYSRQNLFGCSLVFSMKRTDKISMLPFAHNVHMK